MKFKKRMSVICMPLVLVGCASIPENMPLIFGETIIFGASVGAPAAAGMGADLTVGFKSKDIALVPVLIQEKQQAQTPSQQVPAQPQQAPVSGGDSGGTQTPAVKENKFIATVNSENTAEHEVVEETFDDKKVLKQRKTTRIKPKSTGSSRDAYSVFGQFSSNTGAGGIGLGKFFATGSAAQVLSQGFQDCLANGHCTQRAETDAPQSPTTLVQPPAQ